MNPPAVSVCVGGQVAITVVDPCRRFLDQGQGVQYREGHALFADGEVHQ
jgi:hypothetical protein